jgi:hypothetical protein
MTDDTNIQTLAAEIRVLQVGAHQITRGIFEQLDTVRPWPARITPFGRVRSGTLYPADPYSDHKEPAWLELVGADPAGDLVKSVVLSSHGVPGMHVPVHHAADDTKEKYEYWKQRWETLKDELAALPLIILLDTW